MTTEREFMRGERGARTVYQERCCSRGRMRTKSGSVEEFTASALPSSGIKPTSEQQDREIGTKLRGVSNGSPSVDELLKTVKRLEKGFLTLADAVIAEIEGIREDARCWQEEREELWKTVMTIHQSHQKTEVDPIHHRLQSLQKRASDIEKQLQSHDSDARVPVNDRLEELERRAYELEKQAQKQHVHLLQGPK